MNIAITVFGACLLNLVAQVQMHYLYADNPGTGYVSLHNAGDHSPHRYSGKQRRYMGLSNPQGSWQKTGNEHPAIPKNTKSTPEQPTVNDNTHRSAASPKTTEPPKRPGVAPTAPASRQKDETAYKQDPRNGRALKGKAYPTQKYRTGNAMSKDYKSQTQQYNQNFNKGNVYDSQGNIVRVNVHKTQIPAEPQKVKLNSNRQLTALSVQRRDDNYKRIPTSMLVDKTLQKSSSFKERNNQMMSRILDDMTNKVSDRRVKNSEYKKRDTDSSYDVDANKKRNTASENMKKYIGKEITKKSPPKDPARIGSHEEDDIEGNNTPYALFYRMSPESLDHQEGYYLMKSLEADGDKVFSTKEKRLSVNFQNEVDLKKTKTKKNVNPIKLRKNGKNLPRPTIQFDLN